jgi:antitoxin (DNA-binding transcriptional repressor) of toxin-antitoxin stability system
MSRSGKGGGLRVAGIGVAACAACCAGPILGFVAATGLFTVAGIAAFGLVGLLVLVPASLWWYRRHRRAQACASPAEPMTVPVELGRPGHDVVVTEPGVPVARLVAIDSAPVLEKLERDGVLSPPRHAQRPVASRVRRVKARGSVSDLVGRSRGR